MATPNDAPDLSRTAVDLAMAFLEGLGAVALSAPELAGIGKGRFTAGWKLTVAFEGGCEHMFAVVLPEAFPYEAPRIAVLDAPAVLTWPHLEEDKMLCVLPAGTSVDPEAPSEQVRDLLNDAVRLVRDILAGRLDSDFDHEFTAYWRRGATAGVQNFMSLLVPGGIHREVWIWRGKSFHVVAETADDLRNWLANRFGKGKAIGEALDKSLCLIAKAPIRPTDYPRTASDLRRLFAGDDQALDLLTRQALSGGDRDLVLAVPTPTGMGFAAVSVAPGSPSPPGRKRVDALWKGFRKGHMPRQVAVLRATSAASKVTRHRVDRVDHGWIHGRDHDPRQEVLKGANVLVVGCGSLGSSVAELLARAGIGRLTLIDGEVVDWPNISRHALGADQVGQPKASALARRLTAAFPHLPGIDSVDQPLTLATADRLVGRDLVITTTGAWSVDSLVNACQRNGGAGTVLYSWLEPHAAAAHAVTIPPGGACLRCHTASTGVPELAVSQWEGGGMIAVPSCGGTFAPYGAAELAFAHALVAGQALEALVVPVTDSRHATWIGRTAGWQGLGGSLNPAWRQQVGDPGEGGVVVVRPWARIAACPGCGALQL